ncbi:RNA12 protein [Diplogelasinospora grovesii]|uniref:Mitochondrial escape protein 2 n=1 Tax=Diplogelasinospora grovesii TaxID=303347 RepID=A0AAN6NER5_9PEZI|nr:RNA12 protein [Diplogelasinospora grovesii]
MIPGHILFRPAARPAYGIPSLAAARCAARPRPLRPVAWGGQARWPTPTRARWESTTTGEERSGHIHTGPNESILFFDNLFPLKLNTLIWRPWQSDRDLSELLKRFENHSLGIMDPINLVKRAIPPTVPIKVTEIIPRLKDGGAFVKFSHPSELSAAEIEGTLARLLQEKPIKPWFNPFRGIKAGLVQGVPWLEDLYRFPKSRVRVEFVAASDTEAPAELSQESLYSLFRKYGKIAEITSQPADSKVLPKFAYVDFVLVRDAIMARNCMHGFVLREQGSKSATKLRISYEQRVKPHHIWDWITNHPRIVIPLIAALLAAVTVVIFDPIREFFIKAHVQKSFEFTNSRLYKWFKRQTSDIFAFRKRKGEEDILNALFTHRKDLIESIRGWLLETADTFIIVHGPRGSGKKELVLDQALKGRSDVLVLDCKPIVEARGEAGTIRKLAAEVRYRPVFSWANNLSSLIDLAVTSTTGVKAGFSETLESQLVKILQATAAALTQVSLSRRDKHDKDATISDDAYLEAHPERRPVVVINNFLHKSEDSGIIYDKIAEWAAALVQSNVAHVIVLTNDTSFTKSLSKALPDRVFHQVALGDLSPDVAKKFVVSHLDPDDRPVEAAENEDGEVKVTPVITEKQRRQDLAELDECIESLGGRLTDLQLLARRLKIGQSPKKAVAEIIEGSASEILRMFLLTNKGPGRDDDRKWSTEQAWYLIKEIAGKESLRYNEMLLSNTFASSTAPGASSGEAAIDALANAELISVKSSHGRPQTIRAGKPVYQAAFQKILQDIVLKAKMDLNLLTELAKIEAKGIDKVEAELSLLGSLPKQPPQTVERVNYLLAKLQGSQSKIVAYEKEMGELKKILMQEA